jgi:8-oxo-dGTP pyrophosphatase MutT (NUDIX family)
LYEEEETEENVVSDSKEKRIIIIILMIHSSRQQHHHHNHQHFPSSYHTINNNNKSSTASATTTTIIRDASARPTNKDRFGVILKCKETERFLCVQQKCNHYYGFPKGSYEEKKDTDEFSCAQRETKEETGIDLCLQTISQGIRLSTVTNHNRSYVFFLIECEHELPPHIESDNEEIAECKWFTLEELETKRQASFTRTMIHKLHHMKRHDIALKEIPQGNEMAIRL